jgi:SAM-dependent methyltransferase
MGSLAQTIKATLLRGKRFHCPLCGRGYRKFLPGGSSGRANARCPGCNSLERHRLLASLIDKLKADKGLGTTGRVLHVAPEAALAGLFSRGADYLSIDLDGSQAMMAMDITALDFPHESFDIVICNHVLEHVPDDRKALKELFWVLKPDGWGTIQVPMKGEVTQEDLSIADPEERSRLYGQDDHVRQYGRDFLDRLREAGFEVSEYRKEDWLSPDELARLSVDCEESVVLVRRPAE